MQRNPDGSVSAPLPRDEAERLRVLESYEILDSMPEAVFDDFVFIAATICGTPIALVSLVDRDRQWFKARYGLAATETPRAHAFCAHAILSPHEPFVVSDTANDPRFATNPLVTGGPEIRFYAGIPLVTPEGHALGTLCAIDRTPRALEPAQSRALHALAREVVVQLELRRNITDLERALAAATRGRGSAPELARAMADAAAAAQKAVTVLRSDEKDDVAERLRSVLLRLKALDRSGRA